MQNLKRQKEFLSLLEWAKENPDLIICIGLLNGFFSIGIISVGCYLKMLK